MNVQSEPQNGQSRIGFVKIGLARLFALAGCAAALSAASLSAAVVGPEGYATSFDTRPAAADWGTRYITGAAGDVYDLTNLVQTLSAATNSTQVLDLSPADPGAAKPNAAWTSGGGAYLFTRPAANKCTFLMATLQNNSGTNATSARLGYDLLLKPAGTDPDYPGLRAFYSLNGQPNSWAPIGEFSSATPAAGPLSAALTFPAPWNHGSNLYVLWVDDDGSNTTVRPGYGIDNFTAVVTSGRSASQPLTIALASPTNGQWFLSPASVPLVAATTEDGSVAKVEFFVDGAKLGEALASPYTLDWASPAMGAHTLSATVTDDKAATLQSAVVNVFVYDVLGSPYVRVLSPADGTVYPALTNITVTAYAHAIQPVTNVEYWVNGAVVASALTNPYSAGWRVPYGSSDLVAVAYDAAGQAGTSAVARIYIEPPPTDLVPPVLAGQSPAAGATITTLSSISVVFSETVTNVKAADLLVNGVPASAVAGSRSNYTFTVVQPAYGEVQITWAGSHTITDLAYPAFLPFDGAAPGATWSYTLIDRTAPFVYARNPAAGTAALTMTEVTVTFNELVTGVDASDFLVNGQPATAMSGSGSNYTFSFTQPPLGDVAITWAAEHGIADLASPPNAFAATAQWNYTVGIPVQTGNDNFADRIALPGTPSLVRGSNVGATTENREPLGSGWFRRGASVWWSWVAPASGIVQINTFGSSFDTALGVYTGSSVNGLSEVAFNDNATSSTTVSLLSFTATQGTEYKIQVCGAAVFAWPPPPTPSGTIQLSLSMPPAITLLSPTNGNVFLAGTPVALAATASVQSGSVRQVEFFRGTTRLGILSNAPYAMEVSTLPAGSNALYAVVTDSTSQVATSAVATVLIANVGVTLTGPADGAVFANNASVAVNTVTVLPSGAITNVEFFLDGQKFAQDDSAPFSAVWTAVSGGSHRVTALGWSDTGASYASQPVYIGVSQFLVRSNSVWKYLDDGSDQGTAWVAPGFDDSKWASGPAELGYGDGGEATVVASGPANAFFPTTYFRRSFVVSNAAGFASLAFLVQRDDGAIVYLNGVEAGRYNMNAGAVDYLTWAPNDSDDGVSFFAGTAPASLLVEGVNVLAVEVHQTSATSTDVSFDLQLMGVPKIVRNESPVVALTVPANNTSLLAPSDITLTAEASDQDGSVSKVEFFLDGVKLGESAQPPYAFILQAVPAGTYAFTARATDDQGATTVSKPATVRVYDLATRWTAYNDHYAGPGTAPYATAWNAFGTAGGAPGDEGSLRDVRTGATLNAYLTVIALGAYTDAVCGAPDPGTPAYDLFHGFVDFGSGGASHAILVTHDSMVMHLFTGLDPARRYSLRATVSGGQESGANRWTLCTLAGAGAFVPAHTSGVLDSRTHASLAAGEAAFNSGDNRSGQVVGWDAITPGPDGSVMLLSSQFLGAAPGNETPGIAAYAPVAVRLEESGPIPLVALVAPAAGAVITGPTNVILSAQASAIPGVASISYVADGAVIGTTTGAAGSIVWVSPAFGDHVLAAIAMDTAGATATSAPVTIHLVTPPTNTIAPVIAAKDPAGESTLTNLTSVRVTFSQVVVGVDAADLLVNGVPATNVAGAGSNYVFSFPRPAYGLVQVTWASNAGIVDLSWPENLPFYDNNPDNYWSYTLVDRIAPVVASKTPAAGAVLTNLAEITVVFSEPVSGVSAGDLLVNGVAAYGVVGFGDRYTFAVSQPPSGTVNVTWAATHGIADQAVVPNAFNASGSGATWSYTLDARTILMPTNSHWMFAKGTNEVSTPVSAWRLASFDDSAWSNAPAPFFYGDPYSNGVPAYTLLSDMRSNYSSIFLRHTLVLPKASVLTNLFLSAQSDDGFIAWINGVEVARYNMAAGEPAFSSLAASTAPEPQNAGAGWTNLTLPNPAAYLVDGTNVLTIQAFNDALSTSSDFGFNAQLYTYTSDSETAAPRLASRAPSASYLFELAQVRVVFTEPVTNVDAADLLVNGAPAEAVSSADGLAYTFTFPQPPYGIVTFAWASNHGIVDLDITPKPFNDAAAGASWEYILLNPASPHITAVSPTNGAMLTSLTQIGVSFNKPVAGVDAADLLVNGVPALAVEGSGTDYLFTFAHPSYGAVAIGWAPANGITDLETPPAAFETTWPNHAWAYNLVDQTAPVLAAVNPPAGLVAGALTQISVTFSEPVTGVNASDLLVNGRAASAMTGSNAFYTFSFPQPNATAVAVTWASAHGIRDLAATANAFDAAAAVWSYEMADTVAPSLASIAPAPGATVRALAKVTLSFDEPVQGVTAASLTLNGAAAEQVAGSGSGPYVFAFTQPATGLVQVALGSGLQDMAAVPNTFGGSNWTVTLNPNLPPPAVTRGPYLQQRTTNSMIVRWRTATSSDSAVQFGLEMESRTNMISDPVLTTEAYRHGLQPGRRHEVFLRRGHQRTAA